nr:pyruvate kinase alpha/beta domain-containing protein [Listeria monocytogenes]
MKESLASGVAKQGDLIIITAGVPVTESGTTNVMKIQLIGEKLLKAKVLAANLLSVKHRC